MTNNDFPKPVKLIFGVVPWALPLKLIVGAVISVLGSAGLLAYLSEYATYVYAIHYGMRPPVEGVPYLKATVALGSIFLLITGAIAFVSSSLLVRSLMWAQQGLFEAMGQLEKKIKGRSVVERPWFKEWTVVQERLKAQPIWRVLLSAVFVGVSFAGAVVWDHLYEWWWHPLKELSELLGLDMAMLLFGLLGFSAMLSLARPKVVWWVAATAVGINFIFWVGVLFNPIHYSQFLRLVGYGGGFPVTLQISGESGGSDSVNAYLLIRSSDSFIFFDKQIGKIIEVPRGRVQSISHSAGALKDNAPSLPE